MEQKSYEAPELVDLGEFNQLTRGGLPWGEWDGFGLFPAY